MRQVVIKAILEVWENIKKNLKYNLINSITTKVKAVLVVKG